MKNPLKILEVLKFTGKLDLNNIRNLKIKQTDLQVKIYWGSLDEFRHPFIYKYEYSIKDDQTIYSLDIFIEENRADKVLSLLQREIGDNFIEDNPFAAIKDNELIKRIELEMDIILDIIKKDNFLVIQFFKFN